MNIDEKLFDRIAHLARLKFSEEEKPKMMEEMSRIVSWVDKLEELDLDGVEPLTSMSHEMNVTRGDEPTEGLSRDEAMENAPEAMDGYFVVPKVIKK